MTIDGSVTVDVVGADGNYHTLKVQEDTTGGTAEREITWIDSDTGEGRRGSFLIKDGAAVPSPNTQSIDWKQINYIHPDGTTYQMSCLVNIDNNEPFDDDNDNYTIETITICGSGGAEDKDFLTKSGAP